MKQNVTIDKQSESAIKTGPNLSHDGRGIAIIEGKTTFISGALPGEEITYRITQKHRQYNEAALIALSTPSAERTTPPCEHFGVCGGCSLQHMSTNLQLKMKEATLLEQLKHFGKVVPEKVLPPLNGPTTGYRYKARLGVKYVIKKGKLLVGFREKSSRYLADLNRCAVLHPKVGEHLHELSELIASLLQYFHIPQIEVAMSDEAAGLVFRHMNPLPQGDKVKLAAFGEKHQFHIYLQPNPPEPVTLLTPQQESLFLSYTLPEEDLRLKFHPLDFTQINLAMNRLMIKQAMDLLDPTHDETVLDLFCGIGNFTLPLAKRAKAVTGIEGSHEMTTRALMNAHDNNLQNVAFYAANLQDTALNAPWLKQSYDKILLDPPRAGAIEILPRVLHFKAKRIVYISCNPATLARDAGELVHQYHYKLKYAGIMNMFPHTSHIEAMAVFDKE
ncbi:MAG: 23S rRNA (uracil(1939)-C(5))-methyltransferase [Gammaproteobacteria bacterium RIFCSPHIGHO2_12_FULL_43_28]|nr:MAG: 23S rRNA (uracil(1939)-C(5))-methyltransferase [Gammaproteobacteria bacterium RIFCSPHIGHO2_12_FULL_43_28]